MDYEKSRVKSSVSKSLVCKKTIHCLQKANYCHCVHSLINLAPSYWVEDCSILQ